MAAGLKTGSKAVLDALRPLLPPDYVAGGDFLLRFSDRVWSFIVRPDSPLVGLLATLPEQAPGFSDHTDPSQPVPASQQPRPWSGPHDLELQPAAVPLTLQLPSKPTPAYHNAKFKGYKGHAAHYTEPAADPPADAASQALGSPTPSAASGLSSAKKSPPVLAAKFTSPVQQTKLAWQAQQAASHPQPIPPAYPAGPGVMQGVPQAGGQMLAQPAESQWHQQQTAAHQEAQAAAYNAWMQKRADEAQAEWAEQHQHLTWQYQRWQQLNPSATHPSATHQEAEAAAYNALVQQRTAEAHAEWAQQQQWGSSSVQSSPGAQHYASAQQQPGQPWMSQAQAVGTPPGIPVQHPQHAPVPPHVSPLHPQQHGASPHLSPQQQQQLQYAASPAHSQLGSPPAHATHLQPGMYSHTTPPPAYGGAFLMASPTQGQHSPAGHYPQGQANLQYGLQPPSYMSSPQSNAGAGYGAFQQQPSQPPGQASWTGQQQPGSYHGATVGQHQAVPSPQVHS